MNKYWMILIFSGYFGIVFAQKDTTRIKISEPFSPEKEEMMKSEKERIPFYMNEWEGVKLKPDYPEKHKRMTLNDKFVSFKSKSYAPFVVPVALISYGVATQFNSSLRSLDRDTHKEVSHHFPGHYPIDDYTQYLPVAGLYGLAWMGVKPKHSFRDRTFVAVTSHLIMGGISLGSKQILHVERPNGINRRSFPSGHTATAFTGAHLLFREYKDTSYWIGFGGYAVAGFTGVMRVINKKHWVSDVMAGAGVGILSVELAYLLLPVFQKVCGNSSRNRSLMVTPSIGMGYYGAGMAYTF